MSDKFLVVQSQQIFSDDDGPVFLSKSELAVFGDLAATYPLSSGFNLAVLANDSAVKGFEEQADLVGSTQGFVGLRALLALTQTEEEYERIARAAQIATWHHDHRYCSRCGTPLSLHKEDLAFVCGACGFSAYPRISPCVIVLVRKGNQCLLANAAKFQSRRFSTLAGFIESGETAEAAVAREVEEEAGIKIKNIEYQFSQPWPFPHSLMLGFTAEYESGEIVPDGVEILEADWFSADALPEIPPPFTIARRLIDQFLSEHA